MRTPVGGVSRLKIKWRVRGYVISGTGTHLLWGPHVKAMFGAGKYIGVIGLMGREAREDCMTLARV